LEDIKLLYAGKGTCYTRPVVVNLGSTEPFQGFDIGPLNYKIQQTFLVIIY